MLLYTLVIERSKEPELTGDILTGGLLTAEEMAVYQALKTEKRRGDWLYGRYAAKCLIQQVCRAEWDEELAWTDFAVLRKASGAPAVFWLDGNGRPPLTLSISHVGELVFCAVSLAANGRLGCDVEQIAPRSRHFIADYFTAAEQALVGQAPAAQQDALVNAIWSGKEAALKALEVGLRVDTRAVTCLPEVGRTQAWQPLTITLDAARLPTPRPTLTGQWRVQGPYVFTLTTTNLPEPQFVR